MIIFLFLKPERIQEFIGPCGRYSETYLHNEILAVNEELVVVIQERAHLRCQTKETADPHLLHLDLCRELGHPISDLDDGHQHGFGKQRMLQTILLYIILLDLFLTNTEGTAAIVEIEPPTIVLITMFVGA